MAGEILFGLALPRLDAYIKQTHDSTDSLQVALALHHAIWRRFPPGAIAYVEQIRQRLASSNLENRKQVSRELHDRVAHSLATALLRLELHRVRGSSDCSIPSELESAEELLRDALSDVLDISTALRQTVGTRTLFDAVSDYSRDLPESGPELVIRSSGNPIELPASVAEEGFALVVEAIRNALRHAKSSHIEVSFLWTSQLSITVADNGVGFKPDRYFSRSLGLLSMRERATLMGGDLGIESNSQGTRVAFTLPVLGGEE